MPPAPGRSSALAAHARDTARNTRRSCLKEEERKGRGVSAPPLSDSRLRPGGIIRAVLASPAAGCMPGGILCPLTAV